MIETEELIKSVRLCLKGCSGEGCVFNEEANANGGMSGKTCAEILADDVEAVLREQTEKISKLEDYCRVFFNRCRAIGSANGAMCVFCGMRKDCEKMHSI